MPITKVGDINIEHYVEGEGPPLLMIMGFSLPASAWGEPFLRELRPHFQVIRFSNRGTGLTDNPETGYSRREMADDAAGLLEELGISRAHVLGISMGGTIAQELALNHPQRVRGLVLGCTGPGRARGVSPSGEVASLMAPMPGLSDEDQIRKTWPASATPEFIERERGFLEEMLRVYLEQPTPLETAIRQMVEGMSFDSYERLPEVTAPTLIVHGDRDQLVPVGNADILGERIAGSQVRIISGVGHMFFWEKPEESAEAIVEFLKSAVPA